MRITHLYLVAALLTGLAFWGASRLSGPAPRTQAACDQIAPHDAISMDACKTLGAK